jgi:uncharacterized protein (DUF433 family)
MTEQELLKRITVEPGKLSGRPCVRGHRISVAHVVSLVAQGLTVENIIDEHPELEPLDITACLTYAARRVDHPVVRLAAE